MGGIAERLLQRQGDGFQTYRFQQPRQGSAYGSIIIYEIDQQI